VDDAMKNRQLPQTSTILPLLGLIGLGSLVAGFFARH
jgi:LPXTG-motif cell wall-anchored protein